MVLRWRPDADLVTDVPATRRIMPFIMRTRNESIVFFEQKIDVAKTMTFLEDVRHQTGRKATMLHLALYAATRAIHERPRLNRFVKGSRIWARRGIWASFSAKKAKTDDAPIVVVKRRIDPAWSFVELVDQIENNVRESKSEKRSSTDKELALAFLLPTFLVKRVVWLLMWLDELGLLPRAVIDADPLYASFFVANLGSIGMPSAFHHLYEYGNIPIFATIGRAEDAFVLDEHGAPAKKRLMTVRYSFDERIEDGLYCARALELLKEIVEDPARLLGDELRPPTGSPAITGVETAS